MPVPAFRLVHFRRLALALLAGALTFGATTACSGGQQSQTTSEAKEKRTGAANAEKERTPSAPTPDDLAESPCGNPDWAQMPDQHRMDGDPEDSEEDADRSDDDEPSASETESGDAS